MNIAFFFSAVLKATTISHPMKVSPRFHIERKLEPSAVSCFIEYRQEKTEKNRFVFNSMQAGLVFMKKN
jgi:hypothetical protein